MSTLTTHYKVFARQWIIARMMGASVTTPTISFIVHARLSFQEHVNVLGFDENLGPALLSLKTETSGGAEQTRVLLRLRTGTVHEVMNLIIQ